jgi:predicted PurR-regulated permease PerM
MGNSLNISPLVAITALLLWGTIWGITGMLLSIPITVIMVIIFAHFDNTKSIAIMLSEKGSIK